MKSITLLLLSLSAFICPEVQSQEKPWQDATTTILIVVGPSNHPPGTHEVAAGGRLIEYCLEHITNVSGVDADVVYAWAEIPRPHDAYSSIVFIGDSFPGEKLPDSDQVMADIAAMMKRGCGLVCIHYGVGLQKDEVSHEGDHPLLHWMGGYFATKCAHHQSIAKVYRDAKIESAVPDHPVSRGWKTFTLFDEPYINNYFGPDNNQLLPGAFALATSLLPPENPREEIVAWGIQRQDTGRGAGITMPHFYKNWQIEELRRFILNTILWTTKREVPEAGAQTTLPALETFKPESVEVGPKKKKAIR